MQHDFRKYEKLLHKLAHRYAGIAASQGIFKNHDDIFGDFAEVFVKADRSWQKSKEASFATYLSVSCENAFFASLRASHNRGEAVTSSLTADKEAADPLYNLTDEALMPPDEVLMAKQSSQSIKEKLSESDAYLFQLATNPPNWLLSELRKKNEHRKLEVKAGKKRQVTGATVSSIATLLGFSKKHACWVSQNVMNAIRRENLPWI